MNIEEMLAREEIRQRMSEYHIAGDRADASGFVAVFARAGILESDTFRLEGRAAIELWMKDSLPFERDGKRPQFVRHHLTTTKIDVCGDEAAVRAYWLVMTDIGVDHSGSYTDKFVREEGRWLIARRFARTTWRAKDSYVS